MRSASPSAPGTAWATSTTNSCFRSAAQPGRADDERAVLRARAAAGREQLVLRARDVARRHVVRSTLAHGTTPACVRCLRGGPHAAETQLLPRATDVECAALAEEVYTAPVERRRDAERRAHRLASRARQPDGPDRQPQARPRHPGDLRRDVDELRSVGDLRAGEDVGASGGGRHGAAQPEVRRRGRRCRSRGSSSCPTPSITNRPLRDRAEDLEQAPVARAVDAGRPRDDELDAGRAPAASRPICSPSSLRLLIDVAGPQAARLRSPADARRRRARRRCCNARRAGRLPLSRPRRSGRPPRHSRRGSRRRQARPRGRARRCCRRPRRPRRARRRLSVSVRSPADDLGAGLASPRVSAIRPHERADVVAARRQVPREMAAGETGRARDQHLHRSATMVTGEPNSRSRPDSRERAFDGPGHGRIARRPCAARSAARIAGGRSTTRKPCAANARVTSRSAITRYASSSRPARCATRRPPLSSAAKLPSAGKSTTTRQRETRQSSATHVRQSIACISTRRHTAASTLRSASGSACASPTLEGHSRRPRPRRSPRATSSISTEASTPVTIAPACARPMAARPVPVPTSMTRSPATGASASSRSRC